MPLLSVFPPLKISVCRLLASGSLHFATYLRRPGEGKELRVRVGECVEEGGREESGRKKYKGVRDRRSQIESQFRIQYPRPQPLA